MSDPLPPPEPSQAPPPPQLPPAPPANSPPALSGLTENNWAIIIHLSAFLGWFGPGVLNIVAPLVIWLLKRPDSTYLDGVGKRVLNFQISYAIYFYALTVMTAVLMYVLIGFLLLPILGLFGIAWVALTIYGAIQESNGIAYRFPLTIQFLK
jgi:uncharacterized Tic20 family protein